MESKVVKVTATIEELAALDSNGMALYATPGATAPYWAANPSFSHDIRVATPGDFAASSLWWDSGFDTLDGNYLEAYGTTVVTIEVTMPAAI